MLPPLERFLDRLSPEPNTGCWFWLGGLNGEGYGYLRVDGVLTPAHLFGYRALIGPVPRGLELDHLCRNKGCVNPRHLEPVTHKVNVNRGANILRARAKREFRDGRIVCDLGHPWIRENILFGRPSKRRPSGTMQCRLCHNDRQLKRYHERVKGRKYDRTGSGGK
jgi:hypothetical protein